MIENTSIPGIDFQFSWEGPAEHAPGVLSEASTEGPMPMDLALADLAGWVAVTAISGAAGNTVRDAIQVKVRSVLAAFRVRQGEDKLVELKERVTAEMMRHRPNGQLTEGELQQRIDAFFNEIPQ